MSFIHFLFACTYFYIPAAFANMGAFLSKFIPLFNTIKTPIDFHLKIHNKRIVGDHKTIGGYLFGVLLGTLAGLIKYILFDHFFHSLLLFQLDFIKTILLYFIMANGALIGDLLKSTLKRLVDIPPHAPWIPFDEIDHSLFSLLLADILVPLTSNMYVTIIFVYFFLHLLTNRIGYHLHLKDVPH